MAFWQALSLPNCCLDAEIDCREARVAGAALPARRNALWLFSQTAGAAKGTANRRHADECQWTGRPLNLPEEA
jgi:hypothetical protein